MKLTFRGERGIPKVKKEICLFISFSWLFFSPLFFWLALS
jgi:hypothetical protein